MNTINANALASVKSGRPVAWFIVVMREPRALSSISSSPVYRTPRVDTTISLAGIPARAATVARQWNPSGSMMGLTALPAISRYESVDVFMVESSTALAVGCSLSWRGK